MVSKGYQIVLYYGDDGGLYPVVTMKGLQTPLVTIGQELLIERLFKWLHYSGVVKAYLLLPTSRDQQIQNYINTCVPWINVKVVIYPSDWGILRSLALISDELIGPCLLISLNIWFLHSHDSNSPGPITRLISQFLNTDASLGLFMAKVEKSDPNNNDDTIIAMDSDTHRFTMVDDKARRGLHIDLKMLNSLNKLLITKLYSDVGMYFLRKEGIESLKELWKTDLVEDMDCFRWDLIPWLYERYHQEVKNAKTTMDIKLLYNRYGISVVKADFTVFKIQDFESLRFATKLTLQLQKPEKNVGSGTVSEVSIPKGSLIGRDNYISRRVTLKKTSIGNRCNIAMGSRITDTIIMDGVTVGENCVLNKVVLGTGAIIGDRVNLSNCEVGSYTRIEMGVSGKGEIYPPTLEDLETANVQSTILYDGYLASSEY